MQVDYPTRAINVRISNLIKSDVFAEQIGHFVELKRDKNDAKNQMDADATMQKYFSQWLVGAASDRVSNVATNFPIISKKMRDEPGQGFRRSGLWIAIKVFLQLGLTIELGETNGKLLYKLIMLRFMSTMCSYLCDVSELNLNVDTAVHMLGKTARRVEKLNNFCAVNPSIFKLVDTLKTETTDRLRKVRLVLQQHQERHVIKDNKLSMQKKLKFVEHVQHELSTEFIMYLEQRKGSNNCGYVKMEKIEPDEEMIEYADYDPSVAPNIFQTLDNEFDTLHHFSHVENWVLSYLDGMSRDVTPMYLRDLAIDYQGKARDFYRKDPTGYSRMVLTILKIIQVSRFEHQNSECWIDFSVFVCIHSNHRFSIKKHALIIRYSRNTILALTQKCWKI